MQFKRNLSSCTKWFSKLKARFYYRYCSKFNLIWATICPQSQSFAFYSDIRKKLWTHISFSLKFFCYCRKDSNNNNNICLLLSSAYVYRTFMTNSQLSTDTIQIWWNLNEFRYCSNSSKSMICKIDANYFPFHSLNLLPFPIRFKCLKLLQFNINLF